MYERCIKSPGFCLADPSCVGWDIIEEFVFAPGVNKRHETRFQFAERFNLPLRVAARLGSVFFCGSQWRIDVMLIKVHDMPRRF